MTTGADLRAVPREDVYGLEVTAPTKELAAKVRDRIHGYLNGHGVEGDWTFKNLGDETFEFRAEGTEAGESLRRDAHGIAAQFKGQGVEGRLFGRPRRPVPPKE